VRVIVRVVGHAVEYFPGRKDRYDLEFKEPVSVRDIIERLGVNRAFVMAAIVAGKREDFDFVVTRDGTEVVLMTPPAGG